MGASAPPSAASPHQATGPDYCTTDEGVTVVVDLSALGGSIVVRCVDGPLGSRFSGWDALSEAGFSPQAPSRTPGFVCRIGGQPTASQTFDIPENPEYHEQCVNTPPTSAYWGYWYANNGGDWTYSSAGAASHQVIEGGFEGWRFALNSGGRPPAPGIAPQHSVEQPPTTSPTRTGGGTTGPGQPTPSSPTSDGPASGKPTDGTTVAVGPVKGQHRDRDEPTDGSAAGPTSPTSPTSTSEVLVTSDLPATADDVGGSGSATPTMLGIGVLALLGAGAGITAWRRSHRA